MTIFEDKLIEGVGPNAEVVVNENGGLQSKAIGRFDLIPPGCLRTYKNKFTQSEDKELVELLELMILRMENEITSYQLLYSIIAQDKNFLFTVARVLKEGATKYPRNNWQLIPPEDHFNHALIHLYALLEGDVQDDHYGHFLTRMAMFYQTEDEPYNFQEIESH